MQVGAGASVLLVFGCYVRCISGPVHFLKRIRSAIKQVKGLWMITDVVIIAMPKRDR